MRAIRARIKVFQKRLRKLVVDDDSFGVGKNRPLTLNREAGYGVLLKITHRDLLQQLGNIQSQVDDSNLIEFEDEAHISIMLGIKSRPTEEQIKEIEGWLNLYWEDIFIHYQMTFTNIGSDVMVLKVDSEGLQAFRAELERMFDREEKFSFNPHITIGYFTPGTLLREYVPIELPTDRYIKRDDVEIQITDPTKITINQWENLSDEEKLREFEQWLENETGLTIISEDDRFWEDFIDEGFRRGAGRAFDDNNAAIKFLEEAGTFLGRKQNFLSGALNAPESITKVKLLASSNFNLIKGVNDQLKNRLKQDLLVGLVQGDNPKTIGSAMVKSLDITKRSADRIARTEIIRAHAEGQLHAMEEMGVEEISVAVEWTTAGDRRVCPKCRPLQGVVLKVKNAHGMIPRHPNCRCSFVPANVGEETEGQKRSQALIQKAFDQSVLAELPKRAKKNTKAARKRTKWKGGKIKATKAPKSLEELLDV